MELSLLFQFLIGRLDTRFSFNSLAASPLFQFLIGRLDTLRSLSAAPARVLFQFLIGRLDTLEGHIYIFAIMSSFNSS